jgi:hypothetical protein
MTAVLLLLRRWRTPFGTFTFLFAFNTLCMLALHGVIEWPAMIASALSGVFADAFVARYDPSPVRVLEFRVLSTILPLVIWGSHYLVRHLTGGIALQLEFWSGITVMTGLSGLVLGLLVVPPAIPDRPEATV